MCTCRKNQSVASKLWEILVPTVIPNTDGTRFYRTRYHKVWDEKVRAITGGLTIMPPVKGQWVSPDGGLFLERMIPVRIVATDEQIDKIVDMTLEYYSQEAVLCYLISTHVILKYSNVKNNS